MAAAMVCSAALMMWAIPAYLDSQRPYQFYGSSFYSVEPAPGFNLTDQDGGRLSLGDLRGKSVLVYFGFTHGPNVCPVGLAHLAAVVGELTAEERAETQVVFISVDPERDTPEVLREYVPFFDPSFIGLTGTPEEIAAVAKGYGVFYEAHPLEGIDDYTVDHTASVYLIDGDGRLRATYAHGRLGDHEGIVRDLRQVMGTPLK